MRLNKFKFLFSAFIMLSLAFVSCEEDNATENSLSSYVGIEGYKYVGIEEDATLNVEGKVVATETSGSDRTYNLVVDASTTHDAMYYSVPATVTIPSGSKVGTFEVSITGTNLGSGKTLVVGLDDNQVVVDGLDVDADGVIVDVSRSKMTFDIKQVCYDNPFRVEIVTDAYGSETTWELYSDLDFTTPIATGGPYADQAASGAYPQDLVDFCLVDGSYTFVIYDGYSDGMDSGYGNGYYKLTKNPGDASEVVIAQNGVFGANEVVGFSLP